eukprot:Sspe_Gene.12500::Locus_4262_Transcript_1_1_Confidence_1.000_Length_1170::g.12500::m.12500
MYSAPGSCTQRPPPVLDVPQTPATRAWGGFRGRPSLTLSQRPTSPPPSYHDRIARAESRLEEFRLTAINAMKSGAAQVEELRRKLSRSHAYSMRAMRSRNALTHLSERFIAWHRFTKGRKRLAKKVKVEDTLRPVETAEGAARDGIEKEEQAAAMGIALHLARGAAVLSLSERRSMDDKLASLQKRLDAMAVAHKEEMTTQSVLRRKVVEECAEKVKAAAGEAECYRSQLAKRAGKNNPVRPLRQITCTTEDVPKGVVENIKRVAFIAFVFDSDGDGKWSEEEGMEFLRLTKKEGGWESLCFACRADPSVGIHLAQLRDAYSLTGRFHSALSDDYECALAKFSLSDQDRWTTRLTTVFEFWDSDGDGRWSMSE